jgi:serine/threonine protein kinase/tetratricopeptide (TPR) repeat protein
MNIREDRARSLFLAALELGPDEWPAFLDDACATDEHLRDRIDQLLHAHEAMGSIHAAAGEPSATTVNEPIREGPGAVIDSYKLLEQIGEGGFGVVFMAEQTRSLSRKVALKILKPGMDTRQVVARFEAERQALALMDHPNIAQVFDGGETATGRPYFVMQLVRGIPITAFCDENQLPVRQRLELLLSVCQAVQHAHQKGIIHRDIKPSNVLVTLHDGKPVVKVIDFGIAKATGRRLTEKTLFTNFAQMIGTPLYMSPEQAELSGLDVDTRSDIYSLGVLLYELMTGTTPFDKDRLGAVGYDELRRIILEEEPQKPSTRISTLGQAATTLATQRRSDPKHLSQLFRGELDWIVMKCLEKDRNRRYDTATGLARDIEHYLRDEPVQACPPSVAYRLSKFVRRNRTTVTGTVAIVVVLLLAVLGLALSNIRIAREQALTKVQRDEAEANFRKARQAVDEQFTLVSQSKLFEAPGFESLRRDLLESALNHYLDFSQQRPDDPELQVEIAAAHFRLYQVREAMDGEYNPGAMQELDKGVEIVEQLLRRQGYDPAAYTALAGFAKGGRKLYGRYSASEAQCPASLVIPLFERSAAIWEKFARTNPMEVGFQSDLFNFYFALQETQASVGQPVEALANLCKALATSKALAQQYPKIADYRAQLAQAHIAFTWRLRQTGRREEIDEHFRQALELRQDLANEYRNIPNPRYVLQKTLRDYGQWLASTGRQAQAEAVFQRGLILQEKLVSDYSHVPAYRSDLASMHEHLGHLYRDIGKKDEAEREYREALNLWDKLTAEFPENANYRAPYSSYCLYSLLAASHREEEASQILGRLLQFKPETPDGQNYLAWVLAARPGFGDRKRALQLAKRAIEQAPQTGYMWNTLGLAHYRNDNWRDAADALEKSIQVGGGGDAFDRFLLAMACWRLGEKDQARNWYNLALQWMEKKEPHALDEELRQDLLRFRAEAAQLMGVKIEATSSDVRKRTAKVQDH